MLGYPCYISNIFGVQSSSGEYMLEGVHSSYCMHAPREGEERHILINRGMMKIKHILN